MAGLAGGLASVQVTGPLGSFKEGFGTWLTSAGYAPSSAGVQLRLMAQVSRWLEVRGLRAADLTARACEEFLADRRGSGCRWLISHRALAPLLAFLSEVGVPPVASLVGGSPPSVVEVLLARFEVYLLTERGVTSSTATEYRKAARRFLAARAPGGDLDGLTAADVSGAILAEGDGRAVASVQYFVAAVRAFLRFAVATGLTPVDLSAAALTATVRRSWSLPRGVSGSDLRALLDSCDQGEVVGRRDYAVLLLLARMGLRAGEVAALHLEDLDWRAGLVVVRGKGRREDVLPLPVDVGEALANYLGRGRPATTRREVFLTVVAPVRALTPVAVSLIVRRACTRGGIEPFHAHRLRHTAASAMLAAGVPLPEVGQVLRHHDVVSTAIYARVDLDALRQLAGRWPGGEER